MASATLPNKKVAVSHPVARHTDGLKGRDLLSGKDPERHYVFASRADVHMGENYYTELGYVVERAPMGDAPGVRLWRGKTSKPGEPIENQGHVLMSISLEERHKLIVEGDGDSIGQSGIDAIERRIINKERHTVDGLRGVGGYIHIAENSITPEQAFTA